MGERQESEAIIDTDDDIPFKDDVNDLVKYFGITRYRGLSQYLFPKVIVLKNQVNSKTGEDIWSSLILSLPIGEISKMAPKDQVDSISCGDNEEKDLPTEKVNSKRSGYVEQEKSNDAVLEDVLDASDEELVAVPLEASSKRMNKTKTVKDLRNDFDKFASTSSLTLADHVSSATKAQSQVINGKLKMFVQFQPI